MKIKNIPTIIQLAEVISAKGEAIRVLMDVYKDDASIGLAQVFLYYLSDIEHGAMRIVRMTK